MKNTTKVRRTIVEVLEEFRSVIPLDYIFNVFPPLRPREFSVASSVTERLSALVRLSSSDFS